MLSLYLSFIDDEDDRKKFEDIYYNYRKRMVAVAYSVLNNKSDSEDAVHDAFIKIARNMRAIDDPMSEKTLSYVSKAAKNAAINILHKNERRNTFIGFGDTEKFSDE